MHFPFLVLTPNSRKEERQTSIPVHEQVGPFRKVIHCPKLNEKLESVFTEIQLHKLAVAFL